MKNQKRNSILLGAISFLAFSVASNAFAVTMTSKFESSIAEFQDQCDNDCAPPFYVERQVPAERTLAERLEVVAKKQAQAWGDTILEGDYFAAGNTHLESVETLYKKNRLIGYRIVYAEQAWDTSNCRFNPETKQGLETCQTGYIKETSFVAPNLKDALVDEDNFATFIQQ